MKSLGYYLTIVVFLVSYHKLFLLRNRFEKNRTEEELEVVRRKILHLKAQTEGLSIVQKLRQELKEYREILKCSICLDRLKEVNFQGLAKLQCLITFSAIISIHISAELLTLELYSTLYRQYESVKKRKWTIISLKFA